MLDWQTMIALAVVAAAALWLALRVRRIVRTGSRDGEGHVSSCGTCHKNPDAVKTTPLVQLKDDND